MNSSIANVCCDRLISITVVLAVLNLVCSLVINILVRLFCAWEHLLCSITQYGGGGSCPGHNSQGPRGNCPIPHYLCHCRRHHLEAHGLCTEVFADAVFMRQFAQALTFGRHTMRQHCLSVRHVTVRRKTTRKSRDIIILLHKHHQFICPIIQLYAHLHQYS